MQYRYDKYGQPLSVLGFGCMRFTRKGGGIDLEKAEREIMAAYSEGVNYFDTAYLYPGSEAAIGEIFERNGIRDNIKIATKLPQYLIGSLAAAERCFNEELSRLRTDHVDYYLMHHITDRAMWEKLKRIGIEEWIAEKKRSGAIRNIGFSYHGNTENFRKVLDGYDWDICLIQYNYYDEVAQAGAGGLRAAAAKGVPAAVMEPLRGGKLAKLPRDAERVLRGSGRAWSDAEWSFRWLYNQPEVTVVLSGMNSVEMVRENCRTADTAMPGAFTETDFRALAEAGAILRRREKVGCTGCRYCMPCPKGVDIPGTLRCYNAMYTEGKRQGRYQYGQTVGLTREPAFASQCVGCGKCERHCPQNIPIREKLKEADRALRPLPYKLAIGAARKFMFRNTGGKKQG